MIRVDFRGLDNVIRFTTNLPRSLDKEFTTSNHRFMLDVLREAKRLVPKDTMDLHDSIRIMPTKTKGKTKQEKIVVTAPYGIYQEEGYTPHWAYITRSNKLPVPGLFFVSKFTPFLKPAVEIALSKNSQRLAHTTQKAIRRAKR